MKVLVLGATGFVGSYLVERALAAGHDVLGTSYNPTIDPRDWAGFQDRIVRCDIRYREQTDRVIAGFRPDVVYLLSAQSYPALSWQAPIETLDTNVLGTANVYESIRAAGIDPVVVVACSSAQYGEVQADAIPVKEEHPLRPLHPYGISKVATEMLALQYWSNWKIRSVCARIFNTTGARKTGDRTYQIRELVERVVAAARVPIAVETDPALLRPSDEKVIFGDSGRLVARTGWKQQVDIATTLGDMIAYWRRMFGVEEGAA